MYSEKIIIQNLDKFAAREGWMPTPHTFAQVEEFKHYIDSIVKIESNSRSSYISLVRPITEKRRKEIWRWIENEQVMCGLDSGYFDECYAYVCNEGGEIFKFKNRKSQEVFDSVIADFDEQQVAIRLLILKARQVGITTKTALKFLQRMLFIPHTQAVMASVQSDKSELIGRILDIAYNQCPWWLVPRRLPKGAFDNGSVLSIQSGMQATGIAQGWTPTCLAPDTRIRLADGALKRIDTLTDNDVILTHKNIAAHVAKAWKTERTNEPTKIIWVAGVDMPLECTFDHAIYTATGWMQAQDLYAGQLMTRMNDEGQIVDTVITHIEEGFQKEFWDVEVDHADHSFQTEQFAVHNCIHVSELADIPKPKKVIEEGLLRATHATPNLFMVFEGTGGGNTGWLAETWRAAKEDFPKGLHDLCPVFIPWPMATDLYPEAAWIRQFPVPEGFYQKRMEATRKHVIRAESYIRNTPFLSRIAGKDWRMPLEQQWFWEFNFAKSCKNHSQKIWLAQMPADDFEALTGVHDSVFDVETIQEIEDHIYEVQGNTRERKNPVQTYAITGDSIDDGFEPPEPLIDYDKSHIRVTWKSDRGQRYDWVLVPLLPFDEDVELETFDKLLVYEPPQSGYTYSCGIDTADGLGKEDEDRTCVSVTRNRFGDEYDYQVAELVSNRINSAQVVGFAACIAAWYGENSKDPRGVKFCVEQIGRPGDTCQHQLKLMGFHWHHVPRRYDSKKIKDDSGKKQGWYSNVWSVPILMTRFTEAVNGGWYRPASRWLIEELKTLERHAAAGRISKLEHRSGQHDDRVRAAAQSFFTAHDFDILAERSQKRYALPTEKAPPLSKAVCSTNMVSVGGLD
jgi:hypothetical protein